MMCSCNTSMNNEVEEDYVALEIGNFDTFDGGKHTSDYPIWDPDMLNYHQDSSAPDEVTIVFNGNTYTGNYDSTSVTLPNTYPAHRYEGQKVYFEINKITGELTNISFVYEPSKKATLTEADCRVIADGIADDYLVLNDYCVKTSSTDIYSNKIYRYTYYREIKGYKTSDSMTVSIDGNGNVFAFSVNSLGAFKDVESVSINSEKVQNAIDSKLNDIYKDKPSRKGYDIDNIILLKLEDGTVAFLYTINNRFEDGSNVFESQVQLLIQAQHHSGKQ